MVSYEVWLGFIMLTIVLSNGSFDLQEIIDFQKGVWFIFLLMSGFLLFFISALAEYGNTLMMSAFNTILFFGGWLPPFEILGFLPGSFWFGIKMCFFVILFVWVRTALSRYRYDQLMGLGWKAFLLTSIGYLIWLFCFLITFNMLSF